MNPAVEEIEEHGTKQFAEPPPLPLPLPLPPQIPTTTPSAPSPSNALRQPHPINVRFQALVLAEYGIPIANIKTHLNMSINTIHRLRKIARARGFDPAVSPILKFEYVEDAPRSGRPNKVTPEMEDMIVASFLGQTIEGNQKTKTVQVADDIGMSTTTVHRVLAAKGIAFERSKDNPYAGTWKSVPKKIPRKRQRKTSNLEETPAPNPTNGVENISDYQMI